MSRWRGRANRPDLLRAVDLLRRFDPKGPRAMAYIGIMSFVGGLSEAATLVIITSVAVNATEGGDEQEILGVSVSNISLLVASLGLLTLSIVLSVAQSKVAARSISRAALAARQELLESFHSASYQRKTQDRMAVLQEALTTYVDRFTGAFGNLNLTINASLNLLSFAVAAVVVNPFASLALALMGGVLVLVLRPASQMTRASARALTAQRRTYAEGATESVLLARELSVFGVSNVAGEELQQQDLSVAKHFERTRFLLTVTPKLYQSIAFALTIVGLIVLTINDADLGAIGAVVLLLVRSLSFGQQVLTALQSLSEHLPFTDRLLTLMTSYSSESRHEGTVPVGPITEIDLDHVSFRYADGEPALTDVTMSISAGETLGVVGPSGAGKTTLVNLLLRLYEPTSGEITINGTPLREALDAEWHQRTAIVPQEPRLVHGTVADNIRFRRDLSDEAVEAAAEAANIADFVRSLPGGFGAPVGELGMGLSGGQRQRICIARALAGHPDLLVLDEPTSALDGSSEEAIQATLEQLKGKVTMVIVAHRLSTLSICDRLAIFEEGKLAAVGTAAELEATSAYYLNAMRIAGL